MIYGLDCGGKKKPYKAEKGGILKLDSAKYFGYFWGEITLKE